MKAKVLIRSNLDKTKQAVYRIYLEPHFKQAEDDLDLIGEIDSEMNWFLRECEVYNWEDILSNTISDRRRL